MKDQPLTSIIVVNYNGGSELHECLTSIAEHTKYPCELIVVDNASTDGSPHGIEDQYPGILVIRNTENEGYSCAVNRGLERASGQYIAVLNMDVVVSENWLDPMVRFLVENSHVGAVSPLILVHQEPDKINALGQIIQWSGLGFNRKLGWPRRSADEEPTRVSGLHGAVFLIRADLFRRIGGMNESCFLYHEDVDLSWVLYLAGYDIFSVPDSVVYHRYALQLAPAKLLLLERNRWAMLLANLSTLTLVALLPYFAVIEGLIFAYCIFHGRDFLSAKVDSIRQVGRRREAIRVRRAFTRAIRARSDLSILRVMRPFLVWDQVIGLFLDPSAPRVGWLSSFTGA